MELRIVNIQIHIKIIRMDALSEGERMGKKKRASMTKPWEIKKWIVRERSNTVKNHLNRKTNDLGKMFSLVYCCL